MTTSDNQPASQREVLKDNLTGSIEAGLTGRYHEKLASFVLADIEFTEIPGVKDDSLAYVTRRSAQTKQAIQAEAPLAFRRVTLHGKQAGQIGLEVLKINPSTKQIIPESAVSLGIVTEDFPSIEPIKVFDMFTPEDVALAFEIGRAHV